MDIGREQISVVYCIEHLGSGFTKSVYVAFRLCALLEDHMYSGNAKCLNLALCHSPLTHWLLSGDSNQ